jgi:preprotein translocase subunit SecE
MADDKKPAAGKSGAKGAKPAAGVVLEGEAEEPKKKKRTSPFDFLKQVRAEAEKVTWTTWNETWVSTMMVLVMVVIMAVFFLIVDQGVRFGVCNVLPIECASRN